MQLSWSDPRLSVAGDSRRTARHRLLQSWFREQILQMPYGEQRINGAPIGSLLHRDPVALRADLNFLSTTASDYVGVRAREVIAAGAQVDVVGLRHDMLSSQALAFSVFGELRSRPDRGLDVVRAFLDERAVAVETMECLWRPALDLLGDRGAFDAAVITRRADGSRHLVGIEVGYAATPRGVGAYSNRYRRVHEDSGWFHHDSLGGLVGVGTNQLWRRSLLAAACERQSVLGVSSAAVAVLCLADDPHAARALAGVSAALRDPRGHCRVVSLESLAAGLREGLGMGAEWADRFAVRYLDAPTVPAELPDLSGESEATRS